MNIETKMRIVRRKEIVSKVRKTPVEQYASCFWPASKRAISNVETKLEILEINQQHGQVQLPITINNEQLSNSYVCSPYTALISYASQEARLLENSFHKAIIKCSLPILGGQFKRNQINRNVHINNWLFSTNIYPEHLSRSQLGSITELILDSYPYHGVIFRSLNEQLNSELMAALRALGYLLVPSRQVYILANSNEKVEGGIRQIKINGAESKRVDYKVKKKDYRRDLRLLEQTDYEFVGSSGIKSKDIPRIEELYRKLYIEKYSIYNPCFTSHFFQTVLHHPNFDFFGFRNSRGELDAIGGQFELGKVMTMPILGYETSKPVQDGLYRLVTITAQLNAEKKAKIYNRSSGAASFKRARGAVPTTEYSAIYVKHLSPSTQRMWKFIADILENRVVPMMRRLEL